MSPCDEGGGSVCNGKGSVKRINMISKLFFLFTFCRSIENTSLVIPFTKEL